MEVSPWFIYFVGISENLVKLLVCTCVVAAFLLVFSLYVVYAAHQDHDEAAEKIFRKVLCIAVPALVLCAVLRVLIPGQETLIAMKVVPAVANSHVVQKIPDALEKFIDKYTGENKIKISESTNRLQTPQETYGAAPVYTREPQAIGECTRRYPALDLETVMECYDKHDCMYLTAE